MSSSRPAALTPARSWAVAARGGWMRCGIVRHFGRGNGRVVLDCYVALLPVLLLFAYVRLVPIVESFILRFYKWALLSRVRPFVGLANYKALLTDDNFI